MALLGLLPCV